MSADAPVDPDERSPQLGLKYQDRYLLGELVQRGVDLSRPREVLFYCYAASRDSAESIARETITEGFDADVRDPVPADPGRWAVVACGQAVLSPGFVRGVVDYFDDLARRHDAEFDGWEVAVQAG